MTAKMLIKSGLHLLSRCEIPGLISGRLLSNGVPVLNKKEVKVIFVKADGKRLEAKGKVGESLLDVVVNNNLELDGYGACEGTLTCSTCHVILKQNDFDSLPDEKSGEECDMLELAAGLTPTSRLGCQIILSEQLDGLEVQVPAEKTDLRSE